MTDVTKGNILIIEDRPNDNAVKLWITILQNAGYHIDIATTVEEADSIINRIRSKELHIDFAIVDGYTKVGGQEILTGPKFANELESLGILTAGNSAGGNESWGLFSFAKKIGGITLESVLDQLRRFNFNVSMQDALQDPVLQKWVNQKAEQ